MLVLISDGQPTDDYLGGLRTLMEQPWGMKAVRMAIAIGEDADHEALQRFIGHPELRPLQANNPEALVKHIRWVSTAVLQSASSPATMSVDMGVPAGNVYVPPPVDSGMGASAGSLSAGTKSPGMKRFTARSGGARLRSAWSLPEKSG